MSHTLQVNNLKNKVATPHYPGTQANLFSMKCCLVQPVGEGSTAQKFPFYRTGKKKSEVAPETMRSNY